MLLNFFKQLLNLEVVYIGNSERSLMILILLFNLRLKEHLSFYLLSYVNVHLFSLLSILNSKLYWRWFYL